MGGGGGASVPEPTQEERDLQRQQTELLKFQADVLKEQVHQQDLLAPVLYEQLGIKAEYGEDGKISGFSKIEDPLEAQSKEIQDKLNKRTLDALAGNLPVDPALERSLTEGRQRLQDVLQRNLGSGYETSTPGIQALADFDKRAEELRSGARTGQLTLSEGLSLARQGADNQTLGMLMGGAGGIGDMNRAGVMGLSNVVQGQAGTLQQMFQNRNMQFQANLAKAQNSNNLMAGGMGAAAMIGAAMIMSHSSLKKNIEELTDEEVLDGLNKLKLYRWQYKPFTKMDSETHIGPMAEEFKEIFGVGDGVTIKITDFMGVVLAALRALSNRREATVG